MFNRTASVVFLALLAFLIPSYWVEVTYVDPEIEELRASVEALEPELNSTLYTYFRWAFPSSYRYIAPYEEDPYLGYVFPLWQKLRWASRERRRLQELSHSVRRMYGCLRGIRDGVVFCIVLAVCENLYLYF